jgi:competence protein ComEC
MATGDTGHPSTRRVAPLVPVALAVILGISADRAFSPLSCGDWAILAGILALTAGATVLPERCRLAATAAALVAIGGAWHHARWSYLPPDDLAWVIDEAPRPSWLRGVLVSVPEFSPPERSEESGFTRVDLAVTGLGDGRRWHAFSGTVQLVVGGDVRRLRMGQAVTAAGALGAIAGPSNPGEFDRRAALRARGIRLLMSVGEPDGIQPDPQGRDWPWTSWLGQARTVSQQRLAAAVGPEAAPLAAALVLGRRELLDPDLNDAFARTGTTHLLAISGLHLQVLAGALFVAVRGVTGRRKLAFAVLITAVVGYASLVGWMPSVTRSAAMTLGICLAGLFDRGATTANLLAGGAVATLIENPSNLFDTGCQLSFLAVGAIIWAVPPALRIARRIVPRVAFNPYAWALELSRPDAELDALEARYATPGRRLAGRAGSWLLIGLVTSLVVWTLALPLVALRFHLVSPIGVVLNIPLVPITSAALVLSGLALMLPPMLGWGFARAAGGLLTLTDRLVHWGAGISWGHGFVRGPEPPWVLGFYGLAVLLLAGGSMRKWALRGAAVWLCLPLLLAAVPEGAGEAAVDVLDVGHGLAVAIHPEPGRAVLYDCGRMRDPRVGRRLIAPALWDRGVRRLDAVILSHADADHYNGLPDLLDRFPIGKVILAPGFGQRAGGSEASRLLDFVRARGVPVVAAVAEDRLDLGGGLSAAVLHPAAGWGEGMPDNDRSLVLDVERGGRHLLLTGDLDGSGLHALVSRPAPEPLDVIVAPHHGGRSANPPWLYAWAGAREVVVSQRPVEPGAADPLRFLDETGHGVRRTGSGGAILLRWSPGGWAVEVRPDRGIETPPRGERSWVRRIAQEIGRHDPRFPWRRRSSLASWLAGGVGALLGLAAFGLLAVIEWGAWSLVRPGQKAGAGPVEPSAWQPIEIQADDGARLRGAWNPGATGRTVILLHGFGEDRSALVGRAEALSRRGWGVALIDSRGRGASGGSWTTFGGREAGDVRRWLDALADRAGPGFVPVLWGRSMGAAVAIRAATEDPRIAALVLEAPYAELVESVRTWLRLSRIPGWLARPILRRAGRIAGIALDRPSPVELAPRVSVPTLIVHGTDDRIAPMAEVQRLARAFPRPPELIDVPSARHTDVFDVGGEPLADQIAAFLDAALARR